MTMLAPLLGLTCALTVLATPGVAGPKLSYRPEYIDAVCHKKNVCNFNGFKAGQLSKEEFQACRKREADILQSPWPEEIGEYTPEPIEFGEFLRANICGKVVSPFDLGPHFRCRLDRVIFRDLSRKVEFKAQAGFVRFFFIYDHDRGAPQGNSDQEKGAPRALKYGSPWKTSSTVAVVGILNGRKYRLEEHATGGSPAVITTSKWARLADGELSARRNLPYVTQKTAHLYDFVIPIDEVGGIDAGPLAGFRFYPHRCQR